jgi:hypothetical protein
MASVGEESLACSRCGYKFSVDVQSCVVCGTKVPPVALLPAVPALSIGHDTIEVPELVGAERVVRPSLAVLFRLAVGPAADYYTPRFLKYERAGHGAPGWNWPAMLLQCVWAFYRKLWLPGILYALLPAAGALAFLSLAQRLDDWNFDDWSIPWLLCAAACIWLIPGVIAALLSTPLLYDRIRLQVRRAERAGRDAAHAASLLASKRSTSVWCALLLGGSAVAAALAPVVPGVQKAYEEHAVRAQIAASLLALMPLQEEVEERLSYFAMMPHPLGEAAMVARRWTKFLDDVTISPSSGRLRLALGPSIPELWGKTILVAPAKDWLERVHWTCIPVDIPKQYLPKECRGDAAVK